MFEDRQVTAAARQHLSAAEHALSHDVFPKAPPSYEAFYDAFSYDADAARFDDSDGAYAVAEPDPFSTPAPGPLRRPSLRAEIGGQPAGAISTLTRATRPPLPVPDSLAGVLPDGLRRGSTISITSSVSLLLTLLGASSARGAWVAMVGMPAISAEAAAEAGIALERLAIVSPPPPSLWVREDRSDAGARTGPNSWPREDRSDAGARTGWTGASWTTAVGALLDAVDVVVARPGGGAGRRAAAAVTDGEARRLSARARGKDAVLVLFGQQAGSWPAMDVRLSAEHGRWTGIGHGYGRLKQHQLLVSATGKGRSARPRSAELWL
ncbi:MAG: hypothetical protein QOE53_690 [Pseudonocardiales bacterium]|nr:hypothetical protein [Pseudonocardiales bacterium]